MAANVFNIMPYHDRSRIALRGDMSVSFDAPVSRNFEIRFFTTTAELFNFDSANFKFRSLTGAVVNGIVFGGKIGMFFDIMFDPDSGVWYITGNNLTSGEEANGGGGGTAEEVPERPLVFSALPAMTEIDRGSSSSFRGTLSAGAKLANPINMTPGQKLKIIVIQGVGGNMSLAYDTAYGFKQAVIPTLSAQEGSVDVIDAYMTGDGSLICDVNLNYSVITPIAYGKAFHYGMNAAYEAAQADPVNGQTVRVLRSGYRSESNGTIGFRVEKPFNFRLQGVRNSRGEYPVLQLVRGDRPAFGKAIVNIEGGTNVVIEDIGVIGAVADAGNGTGILINEKAAYTLIKNVYLKDNENGVRSNHAETQSYDLIDVLLDNNGWSINHAGFSHSIYAGDARIWRALRCSFVNSVAGHNIKSRALQLSLKQVYCFNSARARELDIPDQAVVHVSDSVFWKTGDAVQNNLIGIGHELISGSDRVQQYFFINCYFHNDVSPLRAVTYLESWTKDGTPNTVTVHFIDCEFGGEIKSKGASTMMGGPHTITLTGGPLGPRVPVGDPRRLFDMNSRDPGRITNPANIALTPLSALPAMLPLEPTPPYPEFIDPLPPVPTK